MVDRIGDCRIVGEIGSGGMAVVYQAIQEPLGRTVAVKALKPSIALDSQFGLRFEREARFMASLQHENIIHVYDFIKDSETMYIIMEYVRGIDLHDLLDLTQYLPSEVAAVIGLQVARALDYAHFRGLIHRDIKPANIIISFQGEVKLMDFGIARDESIGGDLTETGTGVGTPSYMSPEQILGDKLDFRSDIFSLGIVLYQSLTGVKPFVEDESRSVMQKIRLDRFAAPRYLVKGIPGSIERVLARCLEKEPFDRYPTTQALIDDLMEFLARRVPTNYSARLVTYLRDVGVISAEEAAQTLAAGTARGARETGGDSSLVRNALLVNGVLLLAILASGGVLQASSGGFSRSYTDGAARAGAVVSPSGAGHLLVVADPWADVYVDGQYLVTTPSAERFALTPGKHYLNFKHPYYLEEKRELFVRRGQTEVVEVSLRARPAPTVPATGAPGP